MMGFFLSATSAGNVFKEHEINVGAQWLMSGISTIVPRLDFFAKSKWLIYGAHSYEEATLFLIQAAVFIPILMAASIIDFKRKQF
jgi:hypothetical protein